MIINLVGGGEGVVVGSLTVTENGSYTAPANQAYGSVTVNVQPEYVFNGGVLHSRDLAKGATVNEGDFCYYGPIAYDGSLSNYVYPVGYSYSGASIGTGATVVVAAETKTAGTSGTTTVSVYQIE